jgi:hypothetical protein
VQHDDGVAAQEALLIGGPVDGRIMIIEEIGTTGLPPVLQLDQTGVHVGVIDQQAPRLVYAYVRGADLDGLPTYHHVSG